MPLLLLIVSGLLRFFTISYFRFYSNVIYGITIVVLLITTGYRIAFLNDIRNHPQWFGSTNVTAFRHWTGITAETPVRKKNSYQATLQFEYAVSGEQLVPIRGVCLVYFRLTDSLCLPKAGNRLVFKELPQRISSQQIPGAFDFAAYCRRKGIYHQLFTDSSGYRVINIPDYSNRNSVTASFSRWQEQLSGVLRERMTDPQAAGMAAALLVGYKASLDPELAQTYAATGVSHVIAISGMHLGLIYWLITLLLSRLPVPERLFWLKPLTAIVAIWAFSLLAGAGPSVLRAAVMFSFLSGEQFFNRKIPSFNGLAASAFVLLCIQPQWLYDAGFLLSYTAVLSLLLFYQPVYQICFFKNKVADLLWKSTAVTLAAQLVTVPVSLYLFHQFPVYFLVANLIAVPLSTLLLFVAIGVELFYFWPAVSGVLGILLEKGIRFMNSSMQFIEAIPGAVWSPLQISLFQVSLLYLLLTGVYRYWIAKQKQALWLIFIPALLLGLLRLLTLQHSQAQKVLIIYPFRQQDAADLFSGTTALALDITDTAKAGSLQSARTACRRQFRILSTETALLSTAMNRCFDLGRVMLLQVDGPLHELPAQLNGKPCILWLCGGARPDLPRLLSHPGISQVIIGSTASRKRAEAWQQACIEKAVPCHHLVDKGAFVKTLR